MPYVEFATASNFSFLRGASHPEELMVQAEHLGFAGLGLCDRNSVAGVVRAHVIKRERAMTLRYHPGARLVFADGTPDILAYPSDRPAWGRLCRLLTRGNLRAEKGECALLLDDLLEHAEGMELVVMAKSTSQSIARSRSSFEARDPAFHAGPLAPQDDGTWQSSNGVILRCEPGAARRASKDDAARQNLIRLREAAPGRVRLAAAMLHGSDDRRRLARLQALATAARVPLIAVNDVRYHHPDRRPLADVFTCIREHTTLDEAGRKLAKNAERYLKPPEEMARLFRDAPEAIAETLRLSERLRFSLDELRYEYPEETREGFATPQEALVHLAYEGAKQRYPGSVPAKVLRSLEHELKLIAELKYAPYFLTVHDIVRFARARRILCQGRGSAANSAVCFCLGVTEVDPDRIDLLFERFVSAERREPPDIDVDFEHERREEVIQYIYQRYGRERAGIAATVICYRSRSAVREVGKAFGFSADVLDALAGAIWGWSEDGIAKSDLERIGLDPADPRVALLRRLAAEIIGFPRHLSQHVGGFVITKSRLDEVIPIMNAAMEDRTNVEWDKDDLDALGILKVDVLALGMLTCLRKALVLLEERYGVSFRSPPPLRGRENKEGALSLASIPAEDPAVYRMLQRADSLGVFQVESRAQMSMLPRLRPKEFYDLVIEVAIVRPGPIQGDMVHPYLRRRQGLERVEYPSADLRAVLEKTLGVPLFQEQAMKIAIVAGGFTPAEADKLRRAMATFRRTGTIGSFRQKMIEGMAARGYQREFAERCFHQIEGFGEYGFPESHAASFALLVYASAWLKCRYPDVFAAALVNSQPMGFYAPAQIVRDAREHGVEFRAVDINHSDWDATLEPGARAAARLHSFHCDMAEDIRSTHAVRLGFRSIKGMREEDARLVAAKRGPGYDSIRDLWLRTSLAPATIARLAGADVFRSLGLSRRQALWATQGLGRAGDKDDLPLFAPIEPGAHAREPEVNLPPMPPGEEVVHDYRALQLSLKAHPLSFLRAELERMKIVPNEALGIIPKDARVTVSGLVLVRQRPGSAKGVIFATLEDETTIANLIIWPDVFERYRPVVLGARLLIATGRLQREAGVIHVVAEKLMDGTPLLARLSDGPPIESFGPCDEVKRPVEDDPRSLLLRRGVRRQLAALIAEEPALADELEVPAHGTHYRRPRTARPRAAHPPALDPAPSPPGQRTPAPWPKGRNFH